MLHLLHSYGAYPAHDVHHLSLDKEELILYPSASVVVLLNAANLSLVRVLAFSEAFPIETDSLLSISCLTIESNMKIIFAAVDTRIAAWSVSGSQQDTWLIHSTLLLPENHTITTLDSKSGLLAVGTRLDLSVYTLVLENDLPTWSQKWSISHTSLTHVRFAPSLVYIATSSRLDNTIRLHLTASGRHMQNLPHPRPIMQFSWRQSQSASRDDLILYTITADSTIRIFFPVLDSPQYLQLHASLDIFSALPFSIASKYMDESTSAAFWLDKDIATNALNEVVKRLSQSDNYVRRVQEIKEENWDLFLRVLGDGSFLMTAVANLDRRPPTLLKQFTLQQFPSSVLPNLPSNLYMIPSRDPSIMTIVASSPLTIFEISPGSFFGGEFDGLRLSSNTLTRVAAEESRIVRLVRTPEGGGIGVVRVGGTGEGWKAADKGSRLVRSGSWSSADHVVVLQGGNSYITYSASSGVLTLHSTPPHSLTIPAINHLFSIPSQVKGEDAIIGITLGFEVIHIRAYHDPESSLGVFTKSRLPLPSPPRLILPVDPMAWGLRQSWTVADILVSISETGQLAFWVPDDAASWRCTGKVNTSRTGIVKASCSSAKKTSLVISNSNGHELTIWDSKESEFASGMEFCAQYSDSIRDLDWTFTPDNQSILAVGFFHRVELLCQRRMTYFDEGPGWTTCHRIDVGRFIPLQISDSIWSTNGSLLIAAGHQMLLYGALPSPTVTETLFEYAARQNGPLDDYHPQMILQCLLWGKVELVKEIIVKLSKAIVDRSQWVSLPIERFLEKDQAPTLPKRAGHKNAYTSLFSGPGQEDDSEEGFSRPLVTRLIEALEAYPLPHLTPNEQAHLLTLIQTTLEIDEQHRALDANGLRYLISMRSFYILNRRASVPDSPESKGARPVKTSRRERIRYRDMIWAFHSESQGLLLSASIAACNGKLTWSDARALGIPLWLTSIEAMKIQMESIARNEYMAGDNRDPTACSLYYFALGKVKLVHGLWRQAAWHKEQAIMLNFLSNDFSEARWRTAALKNAFALMSKRRFEYAAAFFLLGNSLKDAVNVCIKQLKDFQLAVALARIVEQNNGGSILLEILNSTVLPIAFRNGNRWLASWAFWLLHRRDLAVRILLNPLQDIAANLNIHVTEIGEPHYDDPSLALLFSQLRSKTLQAAKGTSEISGRSEFNFVLQIARVFCRMGCHTLALDLVKSWSFDRPSVITRDVPGQINARPPSPMTERRSILGRMSRRRSTILIDMQIPSQPPTRPVSPDHSPRHGTSKVVEETEQSVDGAGDAFARKTDIGNLMKSAKHDVQVPEFDLNSFF